MKQIHEMKPEISKDSCKGASAVGYTGFLRLCKRVCAQSGNNSLSAMRTTTLQQQQNHNLTNKKTKFDKLNQRFRVRSASS